MAFQLCSELFDLSQHDPADPLPAQVLCDDDVFDAQRVISDVEPYQGDDVAEQLPEQTACRNASEDRRILLRRRLALEKGGDLGVISGLDGPYKKT